MSFINMNNFVFGGKYICLLFLEIYRDKVFFLIILSFHVMGSTFRKNEYSSRVSQNVSHVLSDDAEDSGGESKGCG
jgi:hypothetical protein